MQIELRKVGRPRRMPALHDYAAEREQQHLRQRNLLEQLRYKYRYLNAVDLHWRILQRLGDFGRQFISVAQGYWR